jgi:hypothetical protein
MSIARSTDLLAGEIWTALYSALPSINFNASDPVSINAALRSYVQTNYPENFNDWILSSEFVVILDLLSWLGGVLAYKTDIAARENFIDVAEAKTSILRLARFLSYNPSRCQPSTGVLKITQVATDDEVIDSFGVNLSNVTVLWNDPNNSNWYEQFTMIMNNAFVTTNPFGVPLSAGTVSGVQTQLYRINGFANAQSLSFTSQVSGLAMDFEICNCDFTNGGTLFEKDPNPANAMQLYYLNDNNGNGSAQTGFFLLFKQGTSQQQTFNIATPIQNQLIDIAIGNINQNDVWVDTVDDNGNVVIDWTKVPAILSSNITYNQIASTQRNIFSVITRDNDQISIRFSDGNFGNAPVGNIQVTFRVSNGLAYSINPSEIDGVTFQFGYTNPSGVQKTLYLTCSLFSAVSNSAASETIDQIRQRAPQVYATQNRMVSGEDYNTYPLSSNLAVKIKAVNRVYSGQSRYIDLHDPTGTYQDLSLFADDGILFTDTADTYFEVPLSLNPTADQLFSDYIQPAIDQYTTQNLIRNVLLQYLPLLPGQTTVPTVGISSMVLPTTGKPIPLVSQVSTITTVTWTAASVSLFTNTGYFSVSNAVLGNLVQPGAIVQFKINNTYQWVAVIDIVSDISTPPPNNTAGPVTLSQSVPTGSTVVRILPQALTVLPQPIIDQILINLNKRISFSLWYDYSTSGGTWSIQGPQNDFGTVEAQLVQFGTLNLLLIMNVNYITGLWRINSRGMRYVFESLSAIQWYNDGSRALSQLTGEATADTVRILSVNQDLHTDTFTGLHHGFALQQNYDLTIDRLWSYPDGTYENRRTTVALTDSNNDGYPDQPDLFFNVLSDVPVNTFVFWSNTANPPYDEPLYTVRAYDTDTLRLSDYPLPAIGTVGFQLTSTSSYTLNETFWVMTGNGWQQDTISYRAERGRGPNVAAAWITSNGTLLPYADAMSFQWKHYAPSDHRINPASTNIIDIFVLTYAYDSSVRQWIFNGADITDLPTPDTELDLGTAFSALETFKMFSDTIIWRPVKYKFLFGASADPSVQAQFKVVRVASSSVSDGEIQSKILTAINTFFAVANWDFGETFYFSELAAYIHQQLVGLISSVVIVPVAADATFGDGFEISCDADEIFISTAQISDIVLITTNSAINLRIGLTG